MPAPPFWRVARCLPRCESGTFLRVNRYERHHSPSSYRPLSSYLISPEDLHDTIAASPPSTSPPEPRIIPLCAAWFPANDPQSRTGIQAFLEKRIPKARFFDLERVVNTRSPYPHMLPSATLFAASMGELGVQKEDILVVYDTEELGIFTAPRVAWMLKEFGHPQVHMLNNFRLWVEHGLPADQGPPCGCEQCTYPVPKLGETKLASFEDVREASIDHNKEGREGIQTLDSRSSDQFHGSASKIHDSSGHIPGSISIPYDSLLDPEMKTMLPPKQLRELFEVKGVDPLKPIISIGL